MRFQRYCRITVVFLGLALAALPLHAHHSANGTFDSAKEQSMRGVVKTITWRNPHANVSMEVRDVNGKVTVWTIEIGAPNALSLRGFTRDLIEPMKTYSFTIWPARDGSSLATGRSLILPDGRTFDVSDNWGMQLPAK